MVHEGLCYLADIKCIKITLVEAININCTRGRELCVMVPCSQWALFLLGHQRAFYLHWKTHFRFYLIFFAFHSLQLCGAIQRFGHRTCVPPGDAPYSDLALCAQVIVCDNIHTKADLASKVWASMLSERTPFSA